MSKKNNKEKEFDENQPKKEQVYSNPMTRKIVLLIGFALSMVAFVFALLSVLMLFVDMQSMVPAGQTTASMTKIFSIIAIACSFVGVILSVAGANTLKPIARLSFFLAIVAFFAGIVLLLLAVLGTFIGNVLTF